MLEGIFGNASAEKVLLYLEQYEEGYATAIARTFDDLSLNMAQRQLERFSHTCFQVSPYDVYVKLAARLNRLAPGVPDDPTQGRRGHELPVPGACGRRDALVHQSAAEIVDHDLCAAAGRQPGSAGPYAGCRAGDDKP